MYDVILNLQVSMTTFLHQSHSPYYYDFDTFSSLASKAYILHKIHGNELLLDKYILNCHKRFSTYKLAVETLTRNHHTKFYIYELLIKFNRLFENLCFPKFEQETLEELFNYILKIEFEMLLLWNKCIN